MIGSAAGAEGSGRSFRVEYAIVDRGDEKVVARYLGPRGRRRLQPRPDPPLAAEPGGGARCSSSRRRGPGRARGSCARERVVPEGEGRVLAPAGLAAGAGRRSRPAAGCPRPTTAWRRAIPWTTRWCCGRCGGRPAARRWTQAVEACGAGGRGGRERRARAGRSTPCASRVSACRSRPGGSCSARGGEPPAGARGAGGEAADRRGPLRALGPRGRRGPLSAAGRRRRDTAVTAPVP